MDRKVAAVKQEKLEKQQQIIRKWSSLVALFCYADSDVFAVGLGFYRIPFWKTAVLMFVGKAPVIPFLIGLWFLLPEKLL